MNRVPPIVRTFLCALLLLGGAPLRGAISLLPFSPATLQIDSEMNRLNFFLINFCFFELEPLSRAPHVENPYRKMLFAQFPQMKGEQPIDTFQWRQFINLLNLLPPDDSDSLALRDFGLTFIKTKIPEIPAKLLPLKREPWEEYLTKLEGKPTVEFCQILERFQLESEHRLLSEYTAIKSSSATGSAFEIQFNLLEYQVHFYFLYKSFVASLQKGFTPTSSGIDIKPVWLEFPANKKKYAGFGPLLGGRVNPRQPLSDPAWKKPNSDPAQLLADPLNQLQLCFDLRLFFNGALDRLFRESIAALHLQGMDSLIPMYLARWRVWLTVTKSSLAHRPEFEIFKSHDELAREFAPTAEAVAPNTHLSWLGLGDPWPGILKWCTRFQAGHRDPPPPIPPGEAGITRAFSTAATGLIDLAGGRDTSAKLRESEWHEIKTALPAAFQEAQLLVIRLANEMALLRNRGQDTLEPLLKFIDIWNKKVARFSPQLLDIYDQVVRLFATQDRVSKFQTPYLYEQLDLLKKLGLRQIPLMDGVARREFHNWWRRYFNSLLHYHEHHPLADFHDYLHLVKSLPATEPRFPHLLRGGDFERDMTRLASLKLLAGEFAIEKMINPLIQWPSDPASKVREHLQKMGLRYNTPPRREETAKFQVGAIQKQLNGETVIVDCYQRQPLNPLIPSKPNGSTDFHLFIISQTQRSELTLTMGAEARNDLGALRRIIAGGAGIHLPLAEYTALLRRFGAEFSQPLHHKIAELCPGARKIYFLPDGPLWDIPLEMALAEGTPDRFYGQLFEISTLANPLELLKIRPTGAKPLPPTRQAAVFAPDFTPGEMTFIESRNYLIHNPLGEQLLPLLQKGIGAPALRLFEKKEMRFGNFLSIATDKDRHPALFIFNNYFISPEPPPTTQSLSPFAFHFPNGWVDRRLAGKLAPFPPAPLGGWRFFGDGPQSTAPVESLALLPMGGFPLVYLAGTLHPCDSPSLGWAVPATLYLVSQGGGPQLFLNRWQIPEETQIQFAGLLFGKWLEKEQTPSSLLFDVRRDLMEKDIKVGRATPHLWGGILFSGTL